MDGTKEIDDPVLFFRMVRLSRLCGGRMNEQRGFCRKGRLVLSNLGR